jgi:hypothetical protein
VRRLAEEAGLVGREQVDHVGQLAARAVGAHALQVLAVRAGADLAQAAREPRPHQPLLAVPELDAGDLADGAADLGEVGGRERRVGVCGRVRRGGHGGGGGRQGGARGGGRAARGRAEGARGGGR